MSNRKALLSESLFLQPPCDAVIDQIVGFQFGKLYVGLAKHPQRVLYPRFRRKDRTVVKQTHPLIDVFNILSWGDTQPLLQTTNDRRLVAFVLNEPVRSDQRLERFLHRVRRAVNKTSTRNKAGSLIWNAQFWQLGQNMAAAARYRPAKSVA